VCGQLSVYLDLLLKWNARTNLTAIRAPEKIVQRHFGESLFAASHLGICNTVLDFGSGAGFPGIPIQLLRPDLQVTLAESQGRKAAFLREVCRELSLPTEIFAARVETMPPHRQFDVVTLRAVDRMESAYGEAALHVRHRIMALATQSTSIDTVLDGFVLLEQLAIPETHESALKIYTKKK